MYYSITYLRNTYYVHGKHCLRLPPQNNAVCIEIRALVISYYKINGFIFFVERNHLDFATTDRRRI